MDLMELKVSFQQIKNIRQSTDLGFNGQKGCIFASKTVFILGGCLFLILKRQFAFCKAVFSRKNFAFTGLKKRFAFCKAIFSRKNFVFKGLKKRFAF